MSGAAPFTALVLAGSRGPADPVAAYRGRAHKCLVRAAGVPMLARVLDTLLATEWVGDIMISAAPGTELADDPEVGRRLDGARVRVIAAGASPSLSVTAALAEHPAPYPMLVTTADHPLLRPDMIAHFCRAAANSGADVLAGVTSSATLLATYPDSRRTWLRFSDERYSGANLFALMTPAAAAAVMFWRRVEDDRKRPWRIAQAFGWRALAGYLLRRLTLADAMARVSRVIGCRADAVPMPFAEAAIDVDKPADLDLVERILAAGAR